MPPWRGPVDLALQVVLPAVEARAGRRCLTSTEADTDVQLLVAEPLGPLLRARRPAAASIAFLVKVVVTRSPPPSISSSL